MKKDAKKQDKPDPQHQQKQQQDKGIQASVENGPVAGDAHGNDLPSKDQQPKEPVLHDDDPLWAFHEPADYFDPR